jgi:hypothetical protein
VHEKEIWEMGGLLRLWSLRQNVLEKEIWEMGGQAGEAVLTMKFDSRT